MKTRLLLQGIRGTLHGVALLSAFAAGYWLREGPLPVATATDPQVPHSTSAGEKVAGYSSPPPTPALTTADLQQARLQPQTQQPLSGPAQRLISAAQKIAAFDTKQTLSALKAGDMNPAGEDRLLRQLLIAHYAQLDPETALSYVDSLSGTDHSQQRLTALESWASVEPAAAAAHLEASLTAGLATQEDSTAVTAIVREWAEKDPQSAWQWVSSLPEEARAEALNQLAARWAKKDPSSALAAAQALPSEADRSAVMQPLVAQLAQTQPASTAAWVRSLPSEQQPSATAGLMQSWLMKDARSATQWAQQLPAGSTRDAAVAALVQSPALRRDPATAAHWAATVSDPTLRAQLVNLSFSRWQLHDAAAAERWASSIR
jgi:hypothetical protein